MGSSVWDKVLKKTFFLTPSLIHRFGRILCVETVKDLEAGTELFVKYDITVDGDGLKSALKTALSLGQMFSGKSRKEFAKEVKPYLKVYIFRF